MLPALQLLFALAGTYLLPSSYAARFRAWNEAGQPVTLVAWSLAVPEAAPDGERLAATLSLQQWDSAGAARFDSTFQVASERTSEHEARFSGLLELARAQALSQWRLVATLSSSSPELILGAGIQPAGQGSGLELSDLIIGARQGSTLWVHGAEQTLVAVTAAFDRRDTLQVAFQARSDIPRAQVRTTVTVTDVSDPHRGHRVLMIASDGALHPGVNDFERDVNVARLHPGTYLVELQIGDLSHGGAVVQSATFVLRP